MMDGKNPAPIRGEPRVALVPLSHFGPIVAMDFHSAIGILPRAGELAAMLVVVCFSAGLNVYATVAMLGLLGRANVLALPDSLGAVENWFVIGACVVLFALEFV